MCNSDLGRNVTCLRRITQEFAYSVVYTAPAVIFLLFTALAADGYFELETRYVYVFIHKPCVIPFVIVYWCCNKPCVIPLFIVSGVAFPVITAVIGDVLVLLVLLVLVLLPGSVSVGQWFNDRSFSHNQC